MSKVAIIVPFRNRWDHYNHFISSIQNYFFGKNINYSVIIVEQDNARAFNRGKLCNIGFIEAKEQHCSHVVFHDIDMLPVNIDYSYSPHPVHLISKDIPFDSYFGGITLFPTEVFDKINGFSNKYWGWGFEDDDLRYRCISNNVGLVPIEEKYTPQRKKGLIFNGFDSYATSENKLNIHRDFKIDIKLRLGELIFDHEKQTDDFVIFNIQGSDFRLKYTSFKRFYLEVFDKKNQMYTLYSEISDLRNFHIDIRFNAKERTLKLFINEKLVDEVILEHGLFNYNKVDKINIGSDQNFNHKFKGSLDNFQLFDSRDVDITSEIIRNNVKSGLFAKKHFNFSYIPHRREGEVEKLPHENLGFKDGVWQNSVTRRNQLRFNNEVLLSTHKQEYEGLSDCKFKVHNRKVFGKITHLKVRV